MTQSRYWGSFQTCTCTYTLYTNNEGNNRSNKIILVKKDVQGHYRALVPNSGMPMVNGISTDCI